MDEYQLIDSGNGQKFEKFGCFCIVRPCSQAIWKPKNKSWKNIDAVFSRKPTSKWKTTIAQSWQIQLDSIQILLKRTSFGHVGIFPEFLFLYPKMMSFVQKDMRILNLFSYTGVGSLFWAKKGAHVCNVDASAQIMSWSKQNASLNKLTNIRFITDDVIKFLKKEKKRKSFYDAIILDPPTFGRGSKGQVFKIEEDIHILLELCFELLNSKPKFLLFSCHTPFWTPKILENLFVFDFACEKQKLQCDELIIPSLSEKNLPTGSFVLWKK